MTEQKSSESLLALKVIPLSVITSVVVAAVYIGNLEGRITEIKDSSSYRVVGEEKKRLFLEIGREGLKFQDEIKKITASNKKSFDNLINERIKNLNAVMESRKKEVEVIELKVDKKILEFSKITKTKRREVDLLNKEIAKKRKLLATLDAANAVYSEKIAQNETKPNSVNSSQVPSNNSNNIEPAISNNYFYIQIAASSNKKATERIVNDLKRQNFPAELVNSKGLWKVICCDKYPTREDAINVQRVLFKRFPNGKNVKSSVIYNTQHKPF